jgi:hypothetical protein
MTKGIRSAVFLVGCVISGALAVGCSRAEAIEEIPAGTEVTVVTQDGALVRGKIATVNPEAVTLTGDRPETTTRVARTSITEVKRVTTPERVEAAAPVAEERVRTLTIPDGTTLDVTLATAHASDTSRAEEAVRGTLASPVIIDDVTVIPAGATLVGHVTGAQGSGKVKGRAELGIRFERVAVGPVTYDISTKPLYYVAESTKKDDAVKIGVGAAAGAVIGAITGGKKGAAIGSAIGAGGGTAVVLATDGDEVRLASGRQLRVALTEPLTIRLR